jgi:thiosulfate dehydrogenase
MRFAKGWFAAAVLLVGTAMLIAPGSQPASGEEAKRELPPGELGRVIELGREIVDNTGSHPLSRPFVGNDLTCSSCHLDAGQHPEAASFLGVATAYPAWSPREQRVITLEDRVLNCFMRSMNGTRPPVGSRVSVAVTTYITWLAQGQALKMNPSKPLGPRHVQPLQFDPENADPQRGKELYASDCAYCHGDRGEGTPDGPPVWGPRSYNDGAGLSRVGKLASWLKVAMPLDDPNLTPQDAIDIAAYVNSHDRPRFDLEKHLPPAERLGEYNGKRK